ncbi:expressed unknown protein [Seminavis robusta]|uniref:Uncharacterized protein n=1 Tax=Seminavis robusta TaxID=568900 RepID=A0A9N8E1R7_9STRA|nr:expressed unknown protein [Seminavis robusta]|eukprot:Sro444_g144390.1 n/a (173) ;mRNA; r:52459-52977
MSSLRLYNVLTIVLLVLSRTWEATDAFAGFTGDGKGKGAIGGGGGKGANFAGAAGGKGAAEGGGAESGGFDFGNVLPDPLEVIGSIVDNVGDAMNPDESDIEGESMGNSTSSNSTIFSAAVDVALETAMETAYLTAENLVAEVVSTLSNAVGGGGGRKLSKLRGAKSSTVEA